MDPKVKALWIAYLRGGEYKQGKYVLRDLDDHFDPIGVLVDRAVIEGILPQPRRHDKKDGVFFGYTYVSGDYTTATRVPKAVEQWAGIGYWMCNHIQQMGDKGKTFDQIADYIEGIE